MRQLSATVDALKRDQDDLRQLSTTVNTLKRDLDDIRQLSTTVDALKRDRDDMRQLSTTVDALKRDLDSERSRVTALEQRLQEMPSCPTGYTEFRGICYKAFYTEKTFSDAAAACREDGGTLAIPRDAETNAFLISLHNAVSYSGHFWFGLHDRREEGSFEWVDGSALGTYSSWAPGQPDNLRGGEDCVLYSFYWNDKWADSSCDRPFRFICQAVPGRP
ncbi:alpha-N-acetylgalactosamine-specific lectin-like isoform X2 [Branchiostoma floridae]|uniref:Alpha-N-acetylgalactosamine-specific lectin-like isoform X2 n=1 Tax=Branchiostoma floridae TaxID=7739 RepID=A0A9J7LVK3_BRAFL|nr:alpha-N-acetylgalactosamine-specific lectin-like isoform X2 [Branchiostoma floridae]